MLPLNNHFKAVRPPRVLFIGKSRKAGSWAMRGEQIAATRSQWSSSFTARPADLLKCDIVCFVKHVDRAVYSLARKMKKICVYDVIDSWPQPDAYAVYQNRFQAVQFFTQKWKAFDWDALIFANRYMQSHLGHLAPESITIYHHYRPGILINPIRPVVKRIGYEGNANYLGVWKTRLEQICREKKWDWVINPDQLADLDIGIAVREGEHDGFLANAYKSNVKLANLYGSGTPCIMGSAEVSYHETDCGTVPFFTTEKDLRERLSDLESYDKRIALQNDFLKARPAFSLESVAGIYESFFAQLMLKTKR